ncbi:leucine-rich repeat-containing protein 15-like [Zophobas morio]|uniref:leucine-rich repeat-containing protein 15-like n=1 Tax=Zophobas morio TaxID=2755281 RepID=UPI003083A0B0
MAVRLVSTVISEAHTASEHVDSANITCDCLAHNLWIIKATYTFTNVGEDKIKDSCPQNSTEKKRISIEGTIRTLHEDSFKNISNLVEVVLPNVGLKEIESGTFRNLSNLRKLHLHDNNLHELRNGTFVNLNASSLQFGNNTIVSLESGVFQNLSNVGELNLSKNKITEIRKGVFQNVYLWILNLEKNAISNLEPGTFASMFAKDKFGISLWLANNNLEAIDSQVFNNNYIQGVGLANNSISVLRPGDFNNLPNLDSLHLSGNKIQEVPEGVFNGSRIRILNLSCNKISVIAAGAFNNMTSLSLIEIQHNKLKEWDSKWFLGLPKIIIDASYNDIETIPAQGFQNVPEGSLVELDHNHIKNISDIAFAGLASLHYLNLSYNEIKEWKVDVLKNVVIEEFVDLRVNKIRCSDMGTDVPVLQTKGVLIEDCQVP